MTSLETSFTPALLTGFARILATATGWAWHEDGSDYDPATVGIGVMDYPTGCDRAAALGAYPLTQNPTLTSSMIGLQVRTRGGDDPFDVMALDDAVQAAFFGRFPLLLGTGIHVSSLAWSSGSSLGRDATTRRREWVSNFRFEAARITQ